MLVIALLCLCRAWTCVSFRCRRTSLWCISFAMQIAATPRLAAATQGFSPHFVASLMPVCALPRHCQGPLNNAFSTPHLAKPLPSLPFRAIPLHCLSFRRLAAADHLPAPRCPCFAIQIPATQCIRCGRLRHAHADRFAALLLPRSALLNFAVAPKCHCWSVLCFAIATPRQSLPSLFCSLLCHCDSPQVPASPKRLCAIHCRCVVTKA